MGAAGAVVVTALAATAVATALGPLGAAPRWSPTARTATGVPVAGPGPGATAATHREAAEPHWYTVPSTASGATVVFTVTDNGLGDGELGEADGTILDPGGPGTPAPVPALPTLALALLLALLAWTAHRMLRQSHA